MIETTENPELNITPSAIVMRLVSKSEKDFFEMIKGNSCVSLKTLYKKIYRKQLNQIIKRLELLQQYFNINLLVKKAEFCQITGLPITNLYFNMSVEIKEFEKETLAIISYF